MRISGLKGFQLVSRGQVTVGTKPTTFCLLSSRSVPFGLSLSKILTQRLPLF